MIYLTTIKGLKGVVVLVVNRTQMVSFPAKLNGYKIPSIKEAKQILIGVK